MLPDSHGVSYALHLQHAEHTDTCFEERQFGMRYNEAGQ